jgi:hypothetical protein
MLAGHYAPALVAASYRRDVPLWALLLGAQAVDVGFAVFCLAGGERARIVPGANASNALSLDYMPFSHSLVATAVWAIACGALAAIAWRRRVPPRTAFVVVAAVVASHWFVDLPVHVPDLPLAGDGGPKLGFGLWNARPVALVLELALVVGSTALYAAKGGATRARVRVLGGVLVVLVFAGFFAPTPPTMAILNAQQLGLYAAIAALGAWVTRPRAP